MVRRPRTNPRKIASQERSRATVDALVEATARILIKEGYDRASTNKIAAVAGVSIGSLYQYFPSKEALVAAVPRGLHFGDDSGGADACRRPVPSRDPRRRKGRPVCGRGDGTGAPISANTNTAPPNDVRWARCRVDNEVK